MEKTKAYFTTQRITLIAILAAISIVLFLPPLQIPIVLFYKLDFSTMPVLLGTFAMGPLTGVIILFVKSLTGLLFSTSLGVGELADFLIGLSMILPAGLYYKRDKTRKNAMTGMEIGAVAATAAGVLLNVYLLIPFYGWAFHLPVEEIIAMGQTIAPSIDTIWKFVLTITAPFNIVKWAAIAIVSVIIYKPLSPILHGRIGKRKA
ncbi:MAG TPA: ECF transporter S component [Candidatus Limiplasma sp.]|nr:ECF transporter S component [Candidatus Limiplasma sp.]HRX08798.1 ECF transporter S component [Candidatus Limiplasma sp.]